MTLTRRGFLGGALAVVVSAMLPLRDAAAIVQATVVPSRAAVSAWAVIRGGCLVDSYNVTSVWPGKPGEVTVTFGGAFRRPPVVVARGGGMPSVSHDPRVSAGPAVTAVGRRRVSIAAPDPAAPIHLVALGGQ